MIEHEIAMRWGDIDSYGHVNNVRYLDYAAEGRARLRTDGLLPAGYRVAAIAVDYLVPVLLSARPILVTNELDGDQLVQEICVDSDAGRIVHARVVTQLGDNTAAASDEDRPGVIQQKVPIRLHDLGPDGVVSPERAADLVQELRIAQRREIDPEQVWGKSVVAAVRLELDRPITHEAPGLVAASWTSRIGTSSYVAEVEISDATGALLRASSVMVAWDPVTTGSRPMTDPERAVLLVSEPGSAGVAAPR